MKGHLIALLVLTTLIGKGSWAREWGDKTGQFKVEAELVAVDDTLVVLKTAKNNLLAVRIDQLSDKDREFVSSTSARESIEKLYAASSQPTFTLTDGTVIKGVVTGYGVFPLVVQRKNAIVMVGETEYKELVPAYRAIVPEIVGHFEASELKSYEDLEKWLKDKVGPHRYDIQSATIQTNEDGTVQIPLFMFSPADRHELDAGFARWKALHSSKLNVESKDRYGRDEALRLAAISRYRNQERLESIRESNYRIMQLELLALNAGLTEYWEVSLQSPNAYLPSVSVVVSARDSFTAESIARSKYPTFTTNYVRKLAGY